MSGLPAAGIYPVQELAHTYDAGVLPERASARASSRQAERALSEVSAELPLQVHEAGHRRHHLGGW